MDGVTRGSRTRGARSGRGQKHPLLPVVAEAEVVPRADGGRGGVRASGGGRISRAPSGPIRRPGPSTIDVPTNRNIEDLPSGQGLETPLHPKRMLARLWHSSQTAPTINEVPHPIGSASAGPQSPVAVVLPSPATANAETIDKDSSSAMSDNVQCSTDFKRLQQDATLVKAVKVEILEEDIDEDTGPSTSSASLEAPPAGGVGRPRSPGSGQRSHQPLDFMEARPSTSSTPIDCPLEPTASSAEQLKKMRVAKAADKKNLAKLSSEQKATLTLLQAQKQVYRYLMPDAPPPKRKRRTASPVRIACPLLPGVPTTPPPRQIQPWERAKTVPEQEGGSQERRGPAEAGTSAPWPRDVPASDQPFVFTSLSEIVCVDTLGADVQLVDCEIEFVGFTPNVELPINLEEDEETFAASNVPAPTSGPSPVIFDDVELPINLGSDLEEEEETFPGAVARRCASLAEGELPNHLMVMLDEMNVRDDVALREATSNPDILYFDWGNEPEKFVGQQEVFSGPSGPTFDCEGMSPLQVFRRIWDVEILETIVRETNRYGRHLYSTSQKAFTDFDIRDLWTFLVILMLQSIAIVPVEREYWYSCLPELKLHFGSIMPFKKFALLKRCLHFVNNSCLPSAVRCRDEKLRKIWPIIEHLNSRFSSLYLPDQYIAIDESLLLWKGRLSFAQLIATKAARVGIKSYELCDSRTGYLWKMLFYTGKQNKSQPAYDTVSMDQDEPEGATSQIVYNLVRPLLYKGHTLVMDNFYNSPLLSRNLKLKRTDTMGTIRLKREFVPDTLRNLSKTNTRQGEVVCSHTEDLTLTVWHDANLVSMISTYHTSDVGGKEKYGTYKYKPQVVLDYNLNMGGIDKKDQMLQAFPMERMRNPVWYKKLFRRLLNVSIYNAFVIYNHNKNLNQRQFRVALADEILNMVQVRVPRSESLSCRRDHFPAKADTKRARCKLCYLKKVHRRTTFKCDTCNVNLCIIGCFKEYHLMH